MAVVIPLKLVYTPVDATVTAIRNYQVPTTKYHGGVKEALKETHFFPFFCASRHPTNCQGREAKICGVSGSGDESLASKRGTNQWHHQLSSVFIYLTNSPFGLHVYHLHWVSY